MENLIEVDELVVTNIVDNETDFLSLPCSSCLDTSSGVSVTPEIKRFVEKKELNFDETCDAAHGLSLLVEARLGNKTRTVLFDAGPNREVFTRNVEKLGNQVDLSKVEAFVLSHYHIDHSGGMSAAIELITEARKRSGLSNLLCDMHPNNPEDRGLQTPEGVLVMRPSGLTFSEMSSAGSGNVHITKRDDDHTILDNSFFVSGEIPRHTSYETGLANHMTKIDGKWQSDPEILDERYLAVKVKGRGVVVFSSCSHAGIVNVCRDTMSKAGDGVPLFGVVGGFHLAGGGGMEDRIDATIRDLKALDPRIVVPGHCTGWKAKAKLAEVFPTNMQPCVVGATYKFSSSEKEH